MVRLMKATHILLAVCAATVGGCATAPVQPLMAGDTSIPFAARGGIRDWHSENDQSVYLRDRSGRWYYATFNGTCPNLRAAQTIHFNTDATGTFDRFSAITTEYARCQVNSVIRSPAPAAKGGSGPR